MASCSELRAELAWRESLKNHAPEEEIETFRQMQLPSKPPKRLPHYAVPNTTAILPNYHNEEQDVIQRAFAAANYDLIRELPEELRFTEVHKARREKMEEMRRAHVLKNEDGKVPSQIKATTFAGTFEPFTYNPSPYNMMRQLASKELAEAREKKDVIAGGVDFKPPGRPRKGKHEEPFIGAAKPGQIFEKHGYPYLGGLYEPSEVDILRTSWLGEGMAREGTFVPPGTDRTMTRGQLPDFPARDRAREAVGTLVGLLTRDWEGIDVTVTYDDTSEHILVSVGPETVESTKTFHSYLNILIKNNPLLGPFHLSRMASRWGVHEDGRLLFCIRPPWAKAHVKDAFYAMHPEHRSYVELQHSGFFGGSEPSGRVGIGRR